MPKYYAVHQPFKEIFDNWIDCQAAVHGVSGAKYRKFTSYQAAQHFMNDGTDVIGLGGRGAAASSSSSAAGYKRFHEVIGGGGGGNEGVARGGGRSSYDDEEEEEEEEARGSSKMPRGSHTTNANVNRPRGTVRGVLYFDGGSRGNPGTGGSGAILKTWDEYGVLWEGFRFLGHSVTNNFAEYCGLILGLKEALAMGITDIKVMGDSELVIKQLKGIYQVKSPNLQELHRQARALSRHFASFEIVHVLRHLNAEADALANKAIDLGMNRT